MIIEVIPHVWVGSINMLNNSNFIFEKNIKAIINVEKDLGFLDRKCEYNVLVQKNIEKYDIIKVSQYLDHSTKFIYEKIKKTEGVLVVCQKGYLKAPLIILAYIIRYGLLDKEKAINMIRTKILNVFEGGFYGEKGLQYFIKNL